ncbi:FAD-binding domain-containing protein [Ruegeria arenilitoris]|uniref:FAD-binding domain-containing protein n=1 Tax=Ruegeria arenilitoris TaxID=1173585 RepID=UPI0020C2EC85|nr:FAD-binding domain-containing protein [Ruegeria arenilitoris]
MITKMLSEEESGHFGFLQFTPSRKAGLARLRSFAPLAGSKYAARRNYDFGPEFRGYVSALSPWIRHRLITEQDVLNAVQKHHSFSQAEKFVQEVFWRTYFKGWLEQHPSVWTAYLSNLNRALESVIQNQEYRDATQGRTGIDCFDHWVRELVETGYLHNHSRMWFASIWIFTLRLPWELGADFFLRHLMDGDPASNTLSWRWVAGLHTKGKTYLAGANNIAKFTEGKFNPVGQLAENAEPLTEKAEHPSVALSISDPMPKGDFLLLVTEEDCQIAELLPHEPAADIGLVASCERSPLSLGKTAQNFAAGAIWNSCDCPSLEATNWQDRIVAAAEAAGVKTVVTGFAPVGPVAAKLYKSKLAEAGLQLHQIRRNYDSLAWPHATKGFFGLKRKIPTILGGLGYPLR